jgi:hypothetical protein
MPEYRLYQFTKDNHIRAAPIVLTFASDDEAVQQARQLVDGYDIEVWDGERMVSAGTAAKTPELSTPNRHPDEWATVALVPSGVNLMTRREADFCRRQAERMQALADQCIDRNIRTQVEKMKKEWTDRAFEDRLSPRSLVAF